MNSQANRSTEYPDTYRRSEQQSEHEILARLDRLPVTGTIRKIVLFLGCGFFFELYDLLYSGYIAPGLVKSGMFTLSTKSVFSPNGVAGFIASLFFGLFIGTIACAFLTDRFGRRAIFTWSLIVYSIATFIMAFQNCAPAIDCWRFIAGVGIGVELVTIGTYLAELVPNHVRGRSFACVQAVGFIAVPVVAFLSYLLVPRTPWGLEGWRWIMIIGSSGALFVWFIRRGLPESPRWLARKGRLSEADQVVMKLEWSVGNECKFLLPQPEMVDLPKSGETAGTLWTAPYKRRVIMMSVFNVFQTIGFYGFANWVPTLLVKQGITVTNSLLYSSIISVAAPLGPIIGVFVGDKFERKTVIIAMAAAIVVFGLSFSQMSNGRSLIALGVGLTLASNIMSYTFHTYQAELFPTAMRSRAVGLVYSWSRLSAIFVSFFIAQILRLFGVIGIFAFIAGAMLIVIAVIGVMGPRTRELTLEQISR